MIRLQTLINLPIEADISDVTTTDSQITIRVKLSFQNWQRAVHEGLFHLDEEEEFAEFEPDQPVLLTLRPRIPIVRQLTSETVENILLAVSTPESALNHTEAWLATEIVQNVEVPSNIESDETLLQVGFRTRWATSQPQEEETFNSVHESIEAFLKDEEWQFTRLEENVFRFFMQIDDQKEWMILAIANEEEGACTLMSVPMNKVPQHKRAEAALWMVKQNYEMATGCFEMDTEDGEIRFRTIFPALTHSEIESGLHENLSIMAHHFDTISTFMV